MDEAPHKRFLNDYYTGKFPGSESRGELYNDDAVTQDARFCGTVASMCGIESAGFENDSEKMEKAIRLDVTLHAYMLAQSGIPMLYSGDEVGQVNDYSYKEDWEKNQDSRYIHRGAFRWELEKNVKNPDSVEGRLFSALGALVMARKSSAVFDAEASVAAVDLGDPSLICVLRETEDLLMKGIFNFGGDGRTVVLEEGDRYKDMLGKRVVKGETFWLDGHDFVWLCREKKKEEA